MKKIIPILVFVVLNCFSLILKAQRDSDGSPKHLFFEYGPVGKVEGGISGKNNSHIVVGIKTHKWKEDRPIQAEFDVNYRGITFYDSSNVKQKFGMAEFYIGPRLLISKTSPIYPTASVLGGGYMNLVNVGGLSAIFSVGIYYNFTPPGTNRNGISLELTYRTAKISYNEFVVPPAYGVRVGFFF